MLAAWLTRSLEPDDLAEVELKLGRVPVPVRVPDEDRARVGMRSALPLPSARVKPDPRCCVAPLLTGRACKPRD